VTTEVEAPCCGTCTKKVILIGPKRLPCRARQLWS
jgi:hypothetical protein